MQVRGAERPAAGGDDLAPAVAQLERSQFRNSTEQPIELKRPRRFDVDELYA